jgi:hypothetical protein
MCGTGSSTRAGGPKGPQAYAIAQWATPDDEVRASAVLTPFHACLIILLPRACALGFILSAASRLIGNFNSALSFPNWSFSPP